MSRPIATAIVLLACVAKPPDAGRRAPTRGSLAVQDTVAPFAWTLGPIRGPATSTPMHPAVLRAVTASREAGFDRLVFEFQGDGVPGYQVEYATQPIRACGSGDTVSLDGSRRLSVRFEPAQAHDTLGHGTLARRALAPRLPQVQELKLVCDFEGQVEWAIGVAARRPFRLLEDSQPPRVIVDVRHHE